MLCRLSIVHTNISKDSSWYIEKREVDRTEHYYKRELRCKDLIIRNFSLGTRALATLVPSILSILL